MPQFDGPPASKQLVGTTSWQTDICSTGQKARSWFFGQWVSAHSNNLPDLFSRAFLFQLQPSAFPDWTQPKSGPHKAAFIATTNSNTPRCGSFRPYYEGGRAFPGVSFFNSSNECPCNIRPNAELNPKQQSVLPTKSKFPTSPKRELDWFSPSQPTMMKKTARV